MESEPNPQIDITLIKMMLKSIQEGDINLIKQNIQKYNLNMKLLIDTTLACVVAAVVHSPIPHPAVARSWMSFCGSLCFAGVPS